MCPLFRKRGLELKRLLIMRARPRAPKWSQKSSFFCASARAGRALSNEVVPIKIIEIPIP